MINNQTKVLIVGAGPVGLTMAVQLTRYGIPCRIVEKRSGTTDKSKAIAVHSRTMEIFEDMGIIHEALDRGLRCEGGSVFANDERIVHITIEDLDTPYPFILDLNQSDTEAILWEHLQSLGVEVEWQTKLTNLEQNDETVNVTIQKFDGSTEKLSVDYVCACDGAHSFCRQALNLDFPGDAYPREFLLADVQIDWSNSRNELYAYLSEKGFAIAAPIKGGNWRVITESSLEPSLQDASKSNQESPTLEDLRKILQEIVPTPFVISNPIWLSYFRIHHRMLNHFREGRVFFAGDAAHIHSPVGGQGMNTGIQDAYNLAWKLGLVYQGIGQQQLLDSYDAERRPIAENLLTQTDIAFKAVLLRHPISQTIRDHLAAFLGSLEIVQHRLQQRIAMLTIDYRESPIVGEHRAPVFQPKQIGEGISSILRWHDFGAAPNAGDRAIDATFLIGDRDRVTKRLFNLLKGTSYHLIVFAGANPTTKIFKSLSQICSQVEQHFANEIMLHLVIHGIEKPSTLQWSGSLLLDPDGNFHHRYGARFNCLYLIRPDKYIGFRSQPAQLDPLFKHCERIFAKTSDLSISSG